MLNKTKHIKLFGLGEQPGIKPVFYFFILITFSFKSIAQDNLVPNGSFEEYYSCPTGNDLNDGQFEKVKYWWKPTMGTSDYFNRCNDGVVGVPNNFWGYQEPYDGDGYVGMSLISWYINTGEYIGNEYVQAKLKQPLIPCVEYFFEMKVNFANYSRFGFSRLGALFSINPISKSTESAINISPQIVNTEGFLIDTVKWVTVSGNFVAVGNEQYITIGYFFDNVQNDTVKFQQPIDFQGEGYGYYYIDDVKLIEIGFVKECEYTIPNIITPNNDGINDFFKLQLPTDGSFRILNRWGNLVYENSDENVLWPETNSNLIEGVYFYVLEYKIKNNIKKQTGFIHLVR